MNPSEADRLSATSGGVFELLARWVLDRGGIVFGACYAEDFSVCHVGITDMSDLPKLKGTKYVQSKCGTCFSQAAEALKEDRFVLFSGTACQIVGLKNMLGRDHENLICVDLICHGVPSPAVWQHYVDFRAQKDNAGILPQSISLRCKESGWQSYSVMFDYGSHRFIQPAGQDAYMWGFIQNLYLRESCFHCSFKGLDRASDITLGDYWGVETQHPEMNDGKGTSLVLLHSKKGRRIWNEICPACRYLSVVPAEAVRDNSMAVENTPENPAAEEFKKSWKTEDFDELVWRLAPKPVPPPTPSVLKRLLHRIRVILSI